ncbi:MAG: transcription termination factor Rho [Planctomycetota bacterium]|jgi:transcription termination factor Rho
MSEVISGVAKSAKKGSFVLRDPAKSFRPGRKEYVLPARLASKYRIVQGAFIAGKFQKSKHINEVIEIESICGLKPEEFKNKKPYNELVAIDPCERFNLAASGDPSMRIIDLVAPIGKGTRGLIVSPPKAGKTTLLKQIANAIHFTEPNVRIIVLLIDERPEEVTYFRRDTQAEVLASNIDHTIAEHIELAELTLGHIKVELECGRDIVVLVDSLTRMGRVFNQKGGSSNTGRTMSGGLSSGALQIPRKFFGLARNIENGGSVTIIATTLVDTGSRMDQLIFEEFKGTGNSEIVLDRDLAEARIFPAVNLPASGTRREERLYSPMERKRISAIRRVLSSSNSRDVIESFMKLLKRFPSNEEFLKNMPLDG